MVTELFHLCSPHHRLCQVALNLTTVASRRLVARKGTVSHLTVKTLIWSVLKTMTQGSRRYLVEPVVELLGTGLAAEVASRASELSGDAFLTQLVTVVTAYTLQTQPLDKILLEQQLTSWGGESGNVLKERR